jgi:hypothetical protein
VDFSLPITDSLRRFGAWLLQLHRIAVRGNLYPRSCKVGLLVGTVLNIVNQPEWLLGIAPLNSLKALLTYLTPFLVATYGAAMTIQAKAGADDATHRENTQAPCAEAPSPPDTHDRRSP